jgi:hypothetical protein
LERDWCAALEPFLTGNAQSAYFAVPEKDREDYVKVKKSIFLRYKLTPSSYRSKFRNETKSRTETFLDFASRLENYFKHWLGPSKELLGNVEAETIFRKIQVDQFVSTVRDEPLRLKLIEKEDQSLFNVAKFADTYVLERQMIRDDRDREGRDRERDSDKSKKSGDSDRDRNRSDRDRDGFDRDRDRNKKVFFPKSQDNQQNNKSRSGGRYSDACFLWTVLVLNNRKDLFRVRNP